jgi:hypothetical protein
MNPTVPTFPSAGGAQALPAGFKPGRRVEVDGLIDPRVAKHGGTRRDPKSNYDYPAMMSDGHWRETLVHRHTRWYGCSRCGQGFTGPHAVYTHLAKRHDR